MPCLSSSFTEYSLPDVANPSTFLLLAPLILASFSPLGWWSVSPLFKDHPSLLVFWFSCPRPTSQWIFQGTHTIDYTFFFLYGVHLTFQLVFPSASSFHMCLSFPHYEKEGKKKAEREQLSLDITFYSSHSSSSSSRLKVSLSPFPLPHSLLNLLPSFFFF